MAGHQHLGQLGHGVEPEVPELRAAHHLRPRIDTGHGGVHHHRARQVVGKQVQVGEHDQRADVVADQCHLVQLQHVDEAPHAARDRALVVGRAGRLRTIRCRAGRWPPGACPRPSRASPFRTPTNPAASRAETTSRDDPGRHARRHGPARCRPRLAAAETPMGMPRLSSSGKPRWVDPATAGQMRCPAAHTRSGAAVVAPSKPGQRRLSAGTRRTA